MSQTPEGDKVDDGTEARPGRARGVDARLAAVLTSCGFDAARANADGAALDASDLSAYDLIVCADGATRAAVLELAEIEGVCVVASRKRVRHVGKPHALRARCHTHTESTRTPPRGPTRAPSSDQPTRALTRDPGRVVAHRTAASTAQDAVVVEESPGATLVNRGVRGTCGQKVLESVSEA